jgi:hypothetical protein
MVTGRFLGAGISYLFPRYAVVCVLPGVILLRALGLKGYQLAAKPVLRHALLDSRWLLVAAAALWGAWLGNAFPPTKLRE